MRVAHDGLNQLQRSNGAEAQIILMSQGFATKPSDARAAQRPAFRLAAPRPPQSQSCRGGATRGLRADQLAVSPGAADPERILDRSRAHRAQSLPFVSLPRPRLAVAGRPALRCAFPAAGASSLPGRGLPVRLLGQSRRQPASSRRAAGVAASAAPPYRRFTPGGRSGPPCSLRGSLGPTSGS